MLETESINKIMNNDIQLSALKKIREYFFTDTTNYPFPSTDVYRMFGYGRHSSFKKFLNQDRFHDQYIIKPWVKIEFRKSDVFFLSRELLFLICKEKMVYESEIFGLFLEFKTLKFKTITDSFILIKKKGYVFHLDMSDQLKGTIYSHKLNTINFAKAIDVCEFDIFKFCSQNFVGKFGYSRAECTNCYGFRDGNPIPYISFDHIRHEKRYLYLIFINEVIKKFPLDEFKKEVAFLYYNAIKKLLERQYELDCKEGRVKFNFNKNDRIMNLSDDDIINLKKMYRQAALLCHPDKNVEGESIFIQLNRAYERNDLYKVEEIFKKLSKNKPPEVRTHDRGQS